MIQKNKVAVTTHSVSQSCQGGQNNKTKGKNTKKRGRKKKPKRKGPATLTVPVSSPTTVLRQPNGA
jgi:hypothetical protein